MLFYRKARDRIWDIFTVIKYNMLYILNALILIKYYIMYIYNETTHSTSSVIIIFMLVCICFKCKNSK